MPARLSPERAMQAALEQARRSAGRTFPNPAVGAVIHRRGEILGEGGTRPPPGLHAERVAIDRARRRHGAAALRGATLAVTLEPCDHQGRTPPCTEAILEAGIARVQVGCRDPHERVRGRGLRRLRGAGLDVRVGVLEADCREHHRGFLSVCERGRPFVVLKLASSLDGRIATASGESRWITGPEARRFVHGLRSRVDAVAVGAGTALADDPQLTARRGRRIVHTPVRVVFDGRLRVPLSARLLAAEQAARTWLVCARGARGARERRRRGAHVVEVPRRRDGLDLEASLRRLAEEGLTEMLVEGGGRLAASLLRAGLVDEIHWLQAPMLLGGDGVPALGPLSLERLSDAVRLRELHIGRLGADLHVQGRIGAREKKRS